MMRSWASQKLNDEWLPLLNKGERSVCFGNTEPDCGSDAAAIKTRAIRQGDCYILSGEKTSISGGMQADAILVTAKTDLDGGARGVTCFFVPCDLSGVSKSRFADMGAHPSGRASIFFSDVRIPVQFRVGEEGEGFTKVMSGFDFTRALVAIAAIGTARACLAETVEYTKKRKKFGKSIYQFEGVAFKLAEIATLINASRLMCFQALMLRDAELPHSKESAMAKWYATECATRVIHDMLILFGYEGYSEVLPLEQRLRDVIGQNIGDGTPEIMKLIIARELLGTKNSFIM
jgi:cyclohexanecarboxyl-CoA dehydrogenase